MYKNISDKGTICSVPIINPRLLTRLFVIYLLGDFNFVQYFDGHDMGGISEL